MNMPRFYNERIFEEHMRKILAKEKSEMYVQSMKELMQQCENEGIDFGYYLRQKRVVFEHYINKYSKSSKI